MSLSVQFSTVLITAFHDFMFGFWIIVISIQCYHDMFKGMNYLGTILILTIQQVDVYRSFFCFPIDGVIAQVFVSLIYTAGTSRVAVGVVLRWSWESLSRVVGVPAVQGHPGLRELLSWWRYVAGWEEPVSLTHTLISDSL